MTVRVRWGVASHKGARRRSNQDATFAGPAVFVVADGMGGQIGGSVASTEAVDTFAALPPIGGAVDRHAVEAAMVRAHERIAARAHADPSLEGMGTTVAGLAVGHVDVTVFNVGDSRVYRWRRGMFTQLSQDHSLVGELVRAGQVSAADARVHPERNVILQALGLGIDLDPFVVVERPETGDRYVCCSDGLTGVVDDVEIADVVADPADPVWAAQALVDTARVRGAGDDTSVVVAEITSVDDHVGVADDDTVILRAR